MPAERQRQAIAAIQALGGRAIYLKRAESERRWLPQPYVASVGAVLLDNSEVTDIELAHLQAFPELQTLSLKGAAVTDSGLVHLERLTSLRRLFLDRTLITDAGAARLEKALPKCVIYIEGRPRH